MYFKNIVIVFLVLTINGVHGQKSSAFNFNVNDGLSSNQVYDIIHDDYGYLWFSTDRGLSRYDGYSFNNYGTKDGVPGLVIFDFFKAKNGKIWCASSNNKLFSIQGRDPVFEVYRYSDTIQEYSHGAVVNSLLIDELGQVNIQFRGLLGLLSITKNGKVISKPYKFTDFGQGRNYWVFAFSENGNSILYADKKKINNEHVRVAQINFKKNTGNGFKFESAYSADNELAISSYVNKLNTYDKGVFNSQIKEKDIIALGFLNQNRYWIGYLNGGCELYDASGNLIRKYQIDNSVTQLFEDNQGNIWVSTLDEGVFMYSSIDIGILNEPDFKNYVSISKNALGKLMVGDSYGSIYEKNGWQLSPIHKPKRAHPAFVTFDSDRKINYSVSDSLIFGEELVTSLSSNFIEILNGDLLAIGINQLYLYDLESRKRVLKLSIDKRLNDVTSCFGKYYIASEVGLYRKEDFLDNKTKEILSDYNIRVLEKYKEYLLVGTKGGGLLFIDSTEKIYKTIDKSSGLSSNYINNIVIYNNRLWLCTNRGIDILSYAEDEVEDIRSIRVADGLLSNEINDVYFLNDTAWITTSKGINFLTQINKNKAQLNDNLNLYWNYIKVNNKEVTSQHKFGFKENNFEFGFKGIFLRDGKRLKYRYRLLGGGFNQWTELNSRSIYLSSIEPGNYELFIQVAVNDFDGYLEEISYKFNVAQPYWRTWWFLTTILTFFLALIYLFFKIKVLSYNRDIVREIMREFLRRIRKNEVQINIRCQGSDVAIKTKEIGYIKTDGNYLEIYTKEKKYIIRSSLAKILEEIPDDLEFVQVHRSYVVRIDQISEYRVKSLLVFDFEIPIGRKYAFNLKKIKENF